MEEGTSNKKKYSFHGGGGRRWGGGGAKAIRGGVPMVVGGWVEERFDDVSQPKQSEEGKCCCK